jgi:hypothetical protein
MNWGATILTFLGLGSIAYSMTLLNKRRRARSYYGFLTGGTVLILCAAVWTLVA